jgi:PAS domain S-box-containing protein
MSPRFNDSLRRASGTLELTPFRITIIYVIFGLFLLFLSDVLWPRLVTDPEQLRRLQGLKGAVEILVTGGLIYFLVNRRQQQLQRERNFAQSAIDELGDIFYVVTQDKRLERWNERLSTVTGYDDTEIASMGATDFFQPEDQQHVTNVIETAFETGESFVEVSLLTKDGEEHQYSFKNARLERADGPDQIVGIGRDITERKQREAQLQRRTRAIEEAPVGISISDPDQDDNPLIYVNDAFVDLTGYPREEVLGQNCRFLQGENTDPDRVARIRDAIDAQEPVSIELRNYRKDGSMFWNNLEIAPVCKEDDGVINYIGFQQDVTERKQRQRQLEILDRVLRHNLRNNMTVVRGEAETIHSESSGKIAVSAREIMNTSDQLLEMAEKERAITELLRRGPALKEITVEPLLQRVASTLRSEHPDATIAIDCPTDVTVQAPPEFEYSISELMTNAIMHNDSSSPEVAITVTQLDESTRIEVADNGPRIPEMEREIIVGEVKETPVYHGSGLGLWFVKLVVSQSGGTVTFEKNSPAGNIVRLELPS